MFDRASESVTGEIKSIRPVWSKAVSLSTKGNGWEVVRVFTDNDRSASRYATKTRPEHTRLIKFIESGGADVLVTWESSRAQRDLDAKENCTCPP